MRHLIERFGYKHMRLAMIIITAVITVAFIWTIIMAVRAQHDLNSWTSFTSN
ncbi:hypothetical protein PQ472_11040 [Lacticaseibacillus pabuli]|uniref:Uncharacterized protein n=1 Tax=Lacticaseibacillus pabuli TaxID=3025672 RepID=A0ABY7WQL9_9LACO|nr:hypothetical protein [Lacticaseibacillus sp. KACC 23028]WDF82411.1 hypothetical protein PQ472_11040 [Lacticaseibacillus sp. KACC 23028]